MIPKRILLEKHILKINCEDTMCIKFSQKSKKVSISRTNVNDYLIFFLNLHDEIFLTNITDYIMHLREWYK